MEGTHQRLPPIPPQCPQGHIGMARLQMQYRQGAAGIYLGIVSSCSYPSIIHDVHDMPMPFSKCNECPNDERTFEIPGQRPISAEQLEKIEAIRACDEAEKAAVRLSHACLIRLIIYLMFRRLDTRLMAL